MPIAPSAYDDLVIATRDKLYGKKKWNDISLDRQYHIIKDRFLTKTTPVSGGLNQTWMLQNGVNENARATQLYAQHYGTTGNLLKRPSQSWAMYESVTFYDEQEHDFQGGGDEEILDVIEAKMHAMVNGVYELLETDLWRSPTSSTQAPMTMSGIPHWLQQASGSFDFNGGNPSGFSAGCAGISTTDVPNWANGTFSFSTYDDDDFFKSMRRAFIFTQFRAPDPYPALNPEGKKANWMYFCNYDMKENVQRFLNTRNDNITDSAGVKFQKEEFASVPFEWVPAFDDGGAVAVSVDTLYGVNWDTFDFDFLRGRELKISDPHPTPLYALPVKAVTAKAICNLKCTNRRANFAAYKA